jgi:hypothetical protein
MRKEILTKEQIELLPLIKVFSKHFYLVGGTALALHLGHRRSIDFDLFNARPLNRKRLRDTIENKNFRIEKILKQSEDEFTLISNHVKLTFFYYPFDIPHNIYFEHIITLPDILDLAAMKAYALGKRAKWKDYVDLYVILKDYFSLQDISKRATELFSDLFSEKLFRQQLCYFKDIDHSEQVEFVGIPLNEEEVQSFLTEVAITPF